MEPSDKDRKVLDHIEALVAEEHRLRDLPSPQEADHQRLLAVERELDQYWDLLRQRRAQREFGRNPSDAHLRPSDVVKKYEG